METGPKPPSQEEHKVEVNSPIIVMTRQLVDGGPLVRIPVFKNAPENEVVKLILTRTESEYYAVLECEDKNDTNGKKRLYVYTKNGKRYKEVWFPITDNQKEFF